MFLSVKDKGRNSQICNLLLYFLHIPGQHVPLLLICPFISFVDYYYQYFVNILYELCTFDVFVDFSLIHCWLNHDRQERAC